MTSYHDTTALPAPEYVYIAALPSGHYKVGRSLRPQERVRAFRGRLVSVIPCDRSHQAEREIHSMLWAFRREYESPSVKIGHGASEVYSLPDLIITALRGFGSYESGSFHPGGAVEQLAGAIREPLEQLAL